ncbi:ribosomal protein L7/L12 [Sphingomonas mali]|uniref:ribosomal protein L7/L12 n=1 Tax=Sphingomonas mali TaxID=40682 RepID=UPI00082F3555|nr:ribosomal protein L7/L12 [Sphingomonas mali]
MFVPLPLLILAGLVFLVLLVLAMRPRGRSDDLIGVPRARVTRASGLTIQSGRKLELSAETRIEVERLLANGQVINAVKLVREATGSGLKEAKDAVDEMRRSVLPSR